MFSELKNSFDILSSSYPSGHSINQLLIANIWGISEKKVLVGNGAAELIKALMEELMGKIGIILPTFQEYPNRLGENCVEYFIPKNNNFSYTTEDLKKFSKKVDNLILINPDNPSGNFINKTDLLSLLDYFKENNTRLILDESFVDFTEDGEENTLLSNEILDKYSNLVVIKSISKSYGIPGLRLGILASSDKVLIKQCKNNISIWNINSFAEYFLQIFNKYNKDYVNACNKIVNNRNTFFEQLETINYLRPIKSQANYILCEVTKKYTSNELCQKLLMKNFLIKDCQNKLGFNGKQYIRLAVNSKEDNTQIINVLKKM